MVEKPGKHENETAKPTYSTSKTKTGGFHDSVKRSHTDFKFNGQCWYFFCTVVGLQCASAYETTVEESMVELILSLSVCSDSTIFDFSDDGTKSYDRHWHEMGHHNNHHLLCLGSIFKPHNPSVVILKISCTHAKNGSSSKILPDSILMCFFSHE